MRRRSTLIFLLLILISCLATACAPKPLVIHSEAPVDLKTPAPPMLIHLPGIAGEMPIDRRLVKGLVKGGVALEGQIYDWPGKNRGLPALGKMDENRKLAKVLAEQITQIRRNDPLRRIIITAHSGGAGVAVWALEALPDDVQIDALLLLASALSPEYDLTHALEHTRSAFSFYSQYDDLVLGIGTRTFGTIDRVKTNSSGYIGFTSTDPRLTQFPYDPAWIKIGNAGDHIGPMDDQFAAEILAPLLRAPANP